MFSEEKIHAYIDGALSPEEAAELVIWLADHPKEAQRVHELMELNELLGQAYDAPLSQPVPTKIRQTIEGKKSIWDKASNLLSSWRLTGGTLAFAASVAAAFLIVPNIWLDDDKSFLHAGNLAASNPISQHLNAQLSGVSQQIGGNQNIQIVASFLADNGQACREFEVLGLSDHQMAIALACRENADWNVEFIANVELVEQNGQFVPASSINADPIHNILEDKAAGTALSAEEEQRLIQNNWQ